MTCRPGRFQRVMFSGHKRHHGMKFQSVVTPDGLIALLYGPAAGSVHDSTLLEDSRLVDDLEVLMPRGTEIFSLYGDSAYPITPYILCGFKRAAPCSVQAAWNAQMSHVRIVVEWLFNEVATKWSFLDFKRNMKVFQSPIGQYYVTAAFVTNLHCCCYGNQTSQFFDPLDESTMSVVEYIALID
jgi:nuclease HARBI1